MSLKPFERSVFPEVFVAAVLGIAVWGFYGFPHLIEAALGGIALGCIGTAMWKRS